MYIVYCETLLSRNFLEAAIACTRSLSICVKRTISLRKKVGADSAGMLTNKRLKKLLLIRAHFRMLFD